VYASIVCGVHIRRLAGSRNASDCYPTGDNGVLFQINLCPLRASYVNLMLSISEDIQDHLTYLDVLALHLCIGQDILCCCTQGLLIVRKVLK
jgi:hypothetical protein